MLVGGASVLVGGSGSREDPVGSGSAEYDDGDVDSSSVDRPRLFSVESVGWGEGPPITWAAWVERVRGEGEGPVV